MKRIFSLLLVGLLLLSFAGCSGETGETAMPDDAISGNQQSENSTSNKEDTGTSSGQSGEGYQTTSGNLTAEKDKNFMDFQEKTKPMTQKEAEEYLSEEKADLSEPEYRQAVFTVNSAAAQAIIKEAQDTEELTPEVQELFDKISFRFIEGDSFASSTVKAALLKLGTCEKGEDGIYQFIFYDRTLAQATTNQEGNDHSLNAYTEVLNILLNDPNVDVLIKN